MPKNCPKKIFLGNPQKIIILKKLNIKIYIINIIIQKIKFLGINSALLNKNE